jgi:ATP-binding cassette subfamily B protein
MGMPAEKSLAFGPSARRLLRRLAPERLGLVAVVALGVLSVALSSVGPLVLGHATDVIFAGVIGRGLDPGTSVAAAAAAERAAGNDAYANVLEGAGVVPGQGIDFALLGQVLMGVVVIATSTGSRAASCSAGSPTTSTTSRRACSRRCRSCSPRCSPSSACCW